MLAKKTVVLPSRRTKVRFENTGMILDNNRAIAMGNYFFTDLNGNEAKVEYTLRIQARRWSFEN